jgi:hypothetical protein
MNGCGGSETSQKKEKSKAPHVNPDVWGTQIRIRICRPGHPPNPVNRGLVGNPGAWMWSSFLFYEKGEGGLVPIDPVD